MIDRLYRSHYVTVIDIDNQLHAESIINKNKNARLSFAIETQPRILVDTIKGCLNAFSKDFWSYSKFLQVMEKTNGK